MAYLADNGGAASGGSGAWSMGLQGSCLPAAAYVRREKHTAPPRGRGDVASPLSMFLAVKADKGATLAVDEHLSTGWEAGVGAEGRLVLRVLPEGGAGPTTGLIVVSSSPKLLWSHVKRVWRTNASEEERLNRPIADAAAFAERIGATKAAPVPPSMGLARFAPVWSRRSEAGSYLLAARTQRKVERWTHRLHAQGLNVPQAGRWNVQETLKGALVDSLRAAHAGFESARRNATHADRGSLPLSLGGRRRGSPRHVPVLSDEVVAGSNVVLVQAVVPVCHARLFAHYLPLGDDAAGEDAAPHAVVGRKLAAAADDSVGASAALDATLRVLSGAPFWKRVAARARAVDERVTLAFGRASAEEPDARPSGRRGKARRARAIVDRSPAAMVRYAVSNLAGSVSVHKGRQLVRGSRGDVLQSRPYQLVTGCPSRAFFPRGFLWDEGFHQLLLSRYDAELSATVIASWLRTANKDGWIAREQILGPESESRVPEEFRVQNPAVANPPTLLLAVRALLERMSDDAQGAAWRSFRDSEKGRWEAEWRAVAAAAGGADVASEVVPGLERDLEAAVAEDVATAEVARAAAAPSSATVSSDGSAAAAGGSPSLRGALSKDAQRWLVAQYGLIARFYRWMRASQRDEAGDGFQWKGDRPDDYRHTYASGLDDFPRGAWHTGRDRHVDLASWMAWAARLMRELAETTATLDGVPASVAAAALEDAEEFGADLDAARAVIDGHWSDARGLFCDVGVPEALRPALVGNELPPDAAPVEHVCHEGYVSFFPLFLGLLEPDSPRLGPLLARLQNRSSVLGRAGLRSLSKADPLYGTGDNYWRGKVWININFLAVRSLEQLAARPGPLAEECGRAAAAIRRAVFGAVHAEWAATGTLWENYDEAGRGTGTHPFTGWTALVATMLPPAA